MLNKIIELAKKTGDRCIVWDKVSGEAFVVMPFSDYEYMVLQNSTAKLSQEELLDKINRDISLWKERSSQEDEGPFDDLDTEENEEKEYYFEPIE